MYAGRIVERAPTRALFKDMRSPYTEALMAAIPKLHAPPHTRLAAIAGAPPDPTRPTPGCAVRARAAAMRRSAAASEAPALAGAVDGHQYACWFPLTARRLAKRDGRQRPRAAPRRSRCCSASSTSSSNYGAGAYSHPRRLRCELRRRARRDAWGWSANPAAASRRSAAPCCSSAARVGEGAVRGRGSRRASGERLRRLRRRVQLIFQDPIASLNPRRRIGDIIAEPLMIAGVSDRGKRQRRVRAVLQAVGLDPDLVLRRRPHEFSGGQCQRDLDRPRAGARARPHHLRRAGLGARCVDPRADPQPAGGHEGALRPHPHLHRP